MMSSVRLQFGLLLLGAICVCISPRAEAQRRVRSPRNKPVAQVQQPDPTPVAPVPLRPEQLPAAAPRLTFENGVLTIVAHNSTLGDILRDVKSKTGAAVDVPGNASERVVGQFGPGSPRDVLASLLNGSHFNYVMVGTAADPNSVAQVILTPRTGGETPPAPSAQSAAAGQQNGMTMVQPPVNGQAFPPRSFPQPQPQAQGQVDAADDPAPDSVEETQDESAQDQDTGDNGDQGAPEQVNQGANGQNPNQPTVKTPEQLLQELQRQQQIMQQQQQQQGQNPQQQQSTPQVVYPIPQLQQPPQQEK
jgi:hypothetical protein